MEISEAARESVARELADIMVEDDIYANNNMVALCVRDGELFIRETNSYGRFEWRYEEEPDFWQVVYSHDWKDPDFIEIEGYDTSMLMDTAGIKEEDILAERDDEDDDSEIELDEVRKYIQDHKEHFEKVADEYRHEADAAECYYDYPVRSLVDEFADEAEEKLTEEEEDEE